MLRIVPELSIRFATWIAHGFAGRAHGPLFHRWLPDGPKNALRLGSPDSGIAIWFERCGFRDRGFIEFDKDRREIDPGDMERQAILDAGPLRGELLLRDLTAGEFEAVSSNRVGDADYINVGKRAAKRIDSVLASLTQILRAQYGQYWIEPAHAFDSRRYSLGQHFHLMSATWSTDGTTWHDFRPNDPANAEITLRAGNAPYGELLTRQDWDNLQDLLSNEFQPELAAALAARAHELADADLHRHALIEAVSAVEAAIETRLRSELHADEGFLKSVQSFWELPLPARLVAVGASLLTPDDLRGALKAIKHRNAIIHEGEETLNTRAEVRGLLRVVRALLPGPRLKFGSARLGNEMRANASDWEPPPVGRGVGFI
jgi:hypothetical protein